MRTRLTLRYGAAAALFVLAACAAEAAEPRADGDDAVARQRRELRHRQRRIILNNDGCDCLYFPADKEPTPANFLALRTSPLAGSQVDTVFYCTISSGFSNFTHRTAIGSILTRQVGEELNVEGKTNIARALIDQGTDPLRLVSEWCRANGIECFWSFRMNDTHDGAQRPDKEYPLFPPLKKQSPELMIGTYAKRPRHGAWTAVNYARPEIRDLAFRYVEEVCRSYDVDGVELDFCRHLSYFPGVAFGGAATDAECEMMTGLLRRVRAMAEREGRRRGRPILIAVRVPDSLEYCRAVGLDLGRWLEEDLIDLLVGGFYLQLNPWEYLADLGRKHDVAVYAGLSESRVQGDAPPFGRNSPESYRGRAHRAWQAGVAGIYLFNYFDPEGVILREIGDPAALRARDKIYYAAIRNRDPASYLAGGRRFQTVPILTPQNPVEIAAGETFTISLQAGEEALDAHLSAALHLRMLGKDAPSVTFNGTSLPAPRAADPWIVFPVTPALIKPGGNVVAVTVPPAKEPPPRDDGWTAVYQGNGLPEAPWAAGPQRESVVHEIAGDALLIADRGTQPGDYFFYAYPWYIDPDAETVVEARVKVLSGWNVIIAANGRAYERVSLYPDRIAFYEAKLVHRMDTTDAFHTYRVVLRGRDIRVFADGALVLDGTGRLTTPLPGRNDVRFGASNSPGVGEALWQSVKLRFRSASATLYDMVLSVRYP